MQVLSWRMQSIKIPVLIQTACGSVILWSVLITVLAMNDQCYHARHKSFPDAKFVEFCHFVYVVHCVQNPASVIELFTMKMMVVIMPSSFSLRNGFYIQLSLLLGRQVTVKQRQASNDSDEECE